MDSNLINLENSQNNNGIYDELLINTTDIIKNLSDTIKNNAVKDPIKTIVNVSYKVNNINLNELNLTQQTNIINDVQQKYSIELGIPMSMINVTLAQGSVLVNVNITIPGQINNNTTVINNISNYNSTSNTEILNTIKTESNSQSITIDESYSSMTITNTNNSPVFETDSIKNATENKEYIYNIVVSDVNIGDISTFSTTNLPNWLSLIDNNNNTAILSGTPKNNNVGNHNITIIAEDSNGGISQQIFTINVANVEDNSWNQRGQDIDGEVSGDNSGHSVSLSSDGTIVAIGAIYNDGVNGSDSGHVRVYQY